jgi:regulator of sigma E protease
MLLSFLAIVLVFGVIVLVHEWGHMMAAKACGVAVPDFAIGMGPSLFSFRLGDTRYHICAFPIGGFVRIAGLEGDDALPRTRGELERLARDAEELPAHIAEGHTRSARDEASAIVAHAIEELPKDLNAAYAEGATRPKVGRWKTWRDITGWQKAFVLVGGPAMNFILALAIIFTMGAIGFPQNAVFIAEVSAGSPAEAAGLEPGDLITAIDGKRISNSRQFSAVVAAHEGQSIPLEVRREGEMVVLMATPRVLDGYNAGKVSLGVTLSDQAYLTNEISLVSPKTKADGELTATDGTKVRLKVGDKVMALNGVPVNNGLDLLDKLAEFSMETGDVVKPAESDFILTVRQRDGVDRDIVLPADTTYITLGLQFRPQLQQLPLGESLTRSLQDAQAYMVGMIYGLKMLFSEAGRTSISGPVGIMRMIGQGAQSDLYTFLFIFMLINLNLGLMNLLPIPALDGGRLVFVALSGLGVRINEKREALVHAAGMVVLLSFIVLITFTDIAALI